MKTFKDLEFENHSGGFGGIIAKIFFENGYGASVVGGGGNMPYGLGELYGDGISTFEIAVLEGTEEEWNICYDTSMPINDVISYQSKEQITEILKEIQQLKGV